MCPVSPSAWGTPVCPWRLAGLVLSLTAPPQSPSGHCYLTALDLGPGPTWGSHVCTPSLLQGRCPEISVERIQWICQTLTPGANSGGCGAALAFSSSQTFHPHSTPGRWGLETGFLALLHSQPLGRRKLFCLRPPAQHTHTVTRNQTPSSRRLSSPCPLPLLSLDPTPFFFPAPDAHQYQPWLLSNSFHAEGREGDPAEREWGSLKVRTGTPAGPSDFNTPRMAPLNTSVES